MAAIAVEANPVKNTLRVNTIAKNNTLLVGGAGAGRHGAKHVSIGFGLDSWLRRM